MLALTGSLSRFTVSLSARIYRGLSWVIALALLLSGFAAPLPAQAAVSAPEQPGPAHAGLAGLLFVPNAGQTNASVRYQAQAFGGSVYFTETEVVLALPGNLATASAPASADSQPAPASNPRKAGAVARLRFEGAGKASLQAADEQPGVVNILLGSDKKNWRTGLRTFATLTYAGLYPGVDLRYEGTDGSLKGTYQVAAGADPAKIRWSYQGAKDLVIDPTSGDLRITLPGGQLTEQAPLAWQEINGRRAPVSAHYELRQGSSVGFSLGDYDKSKPLTIDPTLVYSSYLGGGGADRIDAVSLDPATGQIFVTGETSSVPFPGDPTVVKPGSAGDPYPIYPNMFVARLNPDGSTVYRTIIGGSNADVALAISAQNGVAAVAGYTYSSDFPVVAANTYQNGADMVALKLNPDGTVGFAGLLGSENTDMATGVVLQGATLYVTGWTDGILSYPACSPADCLPHGGVDVVAASINTANSTVNYAMQFGGFFSDLARAIAVDDAGNAYLTGATSSTGSSGTAKFPTQGAFQAAPGGGQDAFITQISPAGLITFSSYLGGSGLDEGRGIVVNPGGSVLYLTGRTISPNFPEVAPATLAANGQDAFVLKFFLPGNMIFSSKLLGGSGTETGVGLAVEPTGAVYVSGVTSTTLPDPANPAPFTQALGPGGNNDAFMARFEGSGLLTYNTRFGGSSDDFATGLGVDASGAVTKVYVGGYTNSANFPTTVSDPALGQPAWGGGDDGFLVQLANSLPVVDLNDSDPANGIDYTTTFTEGAGAAVRLSSGSLSVSDLDNPRLAYVKVYFEGQPPDGASEVLGVTLDTANTGISGAYNPASGTLALTGGPNTTLANWATVLGSVTYDNSANAPTPGNRTVTFEANDGLNSNNPQPVATITVVETNDQPVVTLTGSPAVDEDTAGLVGGISLADPDARSGILELTLSVPAGKGTLTVGSGGGSATVVTGSGSTVVVQGTLAALTQALTSLQFKGAQDLNGKVLLTVKLDDKGNTGTPLNPLSDTQSFNITVNPRNDPPVGPATSSQTVQQDGTLDLTLAGLGVSDQIDTDWSTLPFLPVSSLDVKPADGNGSYGPTHGTVSFDKTTGAITYKPTTGYAGSDSFTYRVCDSGIGDPIPLCFDQTLSITVTGVNDPPSFTKGPNLGVDPDLILEDSGAHTITGWAKALSAGPADESSQTLTFILTNTNTNLFTAGGQPKITPNNGEGDLTFTLAPDAFGTAQVTVVLQDSGTGTNTSAPQTFNITVTPVNDAPVFAVNAAATVNEDSGPQTLTGWAYNIKPGPDNENAQAITMVVTLVDDSSLFSQAPQVSSNGALTFTPAPDAHGTTTVHVQMRDNGGTDYSGIDTSAEKTFTITIRPLNDAPTFTHLAGDLPSVAEDSGAHSVTGWAQAMYAGAADETGQTLSFSVDASKTSMFSTQPAVDATTGDLTYTLAPDANGTVTLTVWLHDNGGVDYGGKDTSTPVTLNLVVTPLNDQPVGPASASKTVQQDGQLDLTLAGLGVSDKTDTDWSTIPFLPVSSLDVKPADGNGSYGPTHGTVTFDKTTGAITYKPATGYAGSDSFTYRVCDSGIGDPIPLCLDQTVTITVNGVNDPPSFVKGADLGNAPDLVLEDSGTHTLAGWATLVKAGPADESDQTLNFIVTSTNTALFTADGQPQITAKNGVGDLTFTLAPDAFGSAYVTVQLHDNGGGADTSAAQSFTIFVTPVNDRPTFDMDATVSVLEDSGAKTVSGWAKAIKSGPPNENSQSVTFTTLNDNNGLFSSQPTIAPDGTLTFTPAPGVHGTAQVTVTAQDNGGTDNGGVDTSIAHTFTIAVGPINDLRLSVTSPADPVLTGFGATLTLTATNPNDSPATGLKFTFTLPADLIFDPAQSDPGCTAAGQAITCTAASVPANNGTLSLNVRVQVNPFLGVDKNLAFKVTLRANEPDPDLSNNQANALVKAIYKQHWYQHNFSAAPGSEWSSTQTSTAPNGQTFLGEFNNQSITLHFDNVPEHGQIEVQFDLYIIRSWDGDQAVKFPTTPDLMPNVQTGQSIGPDLWEFQVEGQPLVHSSFTNWANLMQSYPAWHPTAENAWQTGSVAAGTLGYLYHNTIPNMDSVYHITRTIDHSTPTLTLTFRDLGLQELDDESWGIDNITIDLLGTNPDAKKLFIPLMAK